MRRAAFLTFLTIIIFSHEARAMEVIWGIEDRPITITEIRCFYGNWITQKSNISSGSFQHLLNISERHPNNSYVVEVDFGDQKLTFHFKEGKWKLVTFHDEKPFNYALTSDTAHSVLPDSEKKMITTKFTFDGSKVLRHSISTPPYLTYLLNKSKQEANTFYVVQYQFENQELVLWVRDGQSSPLAVYKDLKE